MYERKDINTYIPKAIYGYKDGVIVPPSESDLKLDNGKPCNVFINHINGYDINITRYRQYPEEVIEKVEVIIKKPNTSGKSFNFSIIMYNGDDKPVIKAVKEIVGKF